MSNSRSRATSCRGPRNAQHFLRGLQSLASSVAPICFNGKEPFSYLFVWLKETVSVIMVLIHRNKKLKKSDANLLFGS